MKRILPLTLFLAMSMPMFAQTTYYQYQQYSWRDGGANIRAFGLGFTANDNATAEVNWLQATPGFACNQQAAPFLGFVYYTGTDGVEQPCAPVTLVNPGATITVPTVLGSGIYAHTYNCSGPSSERVEFVGGSVDFTFTYYYSSGGGGRAGGGAGCFARTLTGSLTLQ